MAHGQGRGHPGLHDGVALDHAAELVVEPGPVQRVGHLADQPAHGLPRQAGVGVQGDHIAHALRQGGGSQEGRVGGAAQQPIEFVELAALALPADPAPLSLVPQAFAVQQHEAVAGRSGAIAMVQPRDALPGRGPQGLVGLGLFAVGVAPIGQQGEIELARRAGQIVDLQPLDLFLDIFEGGEQGRDGDQGPQGFGYAVLQVQGREQGGAEAARHQMVDQGDGQVHRGDEAQARQQDQPAAADARPVADGEGDGQQGQGNQQARADIAADAQRAIESSGPRAQGRPEANLGLERLAAGREQIIARVGLAAVLAGWPGRSREGFGRGHGRIGHLGLGQGAAARQLLDGAAVEIAGGKIHLLKAAARLEHVVDQAEALEQLRPVDIRNQPHAGDDVADRDAGGDLPLVLIADHGVGGGALASELLVQPGQRRGYAGILVAQSMHELNQEAVGILGGPMGRQDDIGRLGGLARGAQQAIGDGVGLLASGPAVDDPLGDAPQVFDQHDAQGDGHRPQLADGQRLDLLIGAQIAAQHFGIEQAVGVGDKGPGHPEHARISRKGSAGQLGQLAVIALGQVAADLADLLFDHVKIVDQPLGGRGYGGARVHRLGDVAIGLDQHRLILRQPFRQRGAPALAGGDRLGAGETAGVVFQPLDAEQFGADRRAIIPRRAGAGGAQQLTERRYPLAGAARPALASKGLRLDQHPTGPSASRAAPPSLSDRQASSHGANSQRIVDGRRGHARGFDLFHDDLSGFAMTADGVRQAVGFPDRQVPRPEGGRHAVTHAHGPAVFFLDDIEDDHGLTPKLADQNNPGEQTPRVTGAQGGSHRPPRLRWRRARRELTEPPTRPRTSGLSRSRSAAWRARNAPSAQRSRDVKVPLV